MYIYRTVREIHKKVSVCDTFMASLSLLFLSVIVDCNKKEKIKITVKMMILVTVCTSFICCLKVKAKAIVNCLNSKGFLGTPFLD